jgi:IclR family KDG regulon transcriptional repressor
MATSSQANGKNHKGTRTSGSARTAAADAHATARDHDLVAVDRTLDLLDALSETGPASAAQLADAAHCPRTAALKLLRALQVRGFAVEDEAQGVWRLGARWSVMGRTATDQGALAATAMPFLISLGKATGENAYIRVRDAMENETIAVYQTDPTVRLYTEVGKRGPLHAGNSRLLLAYAPEAVQTQVLAQRLPRFTPATRTDASWIAADLQRIRTRGYLISSDEVVAGAVSVAAPVRDASGQVVAVMHVSAPSMRMRPPRPRALVPMVIDAANKLSQALGWTPQRVTRVTNDTAGPVKFPMAGSQIQVARPHSIFR